MNKQIMFTWVTGKERSEFVKWQRNRGHSFEQVNIWRDRGINVLMF